MAEFLIIDFMEYKGPELITGFPNLVPIPRSERFYEIDKRHYRVQFPVVLSFAMTIHKSQGSTLEKAYIDIGDKEFSLGLTYVAFSRVKKFENLFLKGFTMSRFEMVNKGISFENRVREWERILALRK